MSGGVITTSGFTPPRGVGKVWLENLGAPGEISAGSSVVEAFVFTSGGAAVKWEGFRPYRIVREGASGGL